MGSLLSISIFNQDYFIQQLKAPGIRVVREAPLKFMLHLGIARKGGEGGLNPCSDGLGQLFWEKFA